MIKDPFEPTQADDCVHCRYGLPGPNEASQSSQQANPTAAAAMVTSAAASAGQPAAALSSSTQQVVAVKWTLDEDTASVGLACTPIGNPAQQPFVIEPTSALLAGNSSARFTVRFSNPDAMIHEGYLLGTQRLVSAGQSPLKLHCGVLRDHSDTQAEAAQQPADQGMQQDVGFRAEGSGQDEDSVDSSGSMLVSCQISGGFHPHAAPPPTPLRPLRVSLKAHVIQPHLEPEFPDATDSLTFMCQAIHDPITHPSYTQPMTLTNMHSCPLQFTLAVQAGAPFQINKAAASAVSKLAGLQTARLPAGLQSSKRSVSTMGLLDDSITLQPHEHVAVYVHYNPQQSKQSETAQLSRTQQAAKDSAADIQSAQESRMMQDESAHGNLVIVYQNGQLQSVPIQAQCLHPSVQAKTTTLQFGAVHLHSPKVLQLEVLNSTTVDATWSAEVKCCSRAGDSTAAASVSFAARVPGTGMGQQSMSQVVQTTKQASNIFACVPSVGTLAGRGLGMPKKLQLSVKFAPEQLGMYNAVVVLQVACGSTVSIALCGEGTLTEADEVQAKLQGI